MKIITAEQIRKVDSETIQKQKISSWELMERASRAFVGEFMKFYGDNYKVITICGTGNNGGDGLAISRMLRQEGYEINVFVIEVGANRSKDFIKNREILSEQLSVTIIKNSTELKIEILEKTVIIDAVFGNGLNRTLEEPFVSIIELINELACEKVSVDIASGLLADAYTKQKNAVVKPNRTICLEIPKLAFYMEENEAFVGELSIVDIGLEKEVIEKTDSSFYIIRENSLPTYERPKHGHKGTFGHALLVAGQKGMVGAAVLATKACLRAGAGKITTHVPNFGNQILQISVPEAIVNTSDNEIHFNTSWNKFDFKPYNAIGIGPGIGKSNKEGYEDFLKQITNKKLVIDADGINMLEAKLLGLLPPNTILTPHIKEFKNLSSESWENDFEKIEILRAFSKKHQLIVCLKGHYTATALPNGEIFFNTTGNNGMATAGSGDVLTGMILGYLAQNIEPAEAAIRAIFDHGAAGDRAANFRSKKSIIASDIIDFIR